jgi:hypothetical protein
VLKEVVIDASDPYAFVAVIVTLYGVLTVKPVHSTDPAPDPTAPGDAVYVPKDPPEGDVIRYV